MSQTKILAGGFDADVITGTTALAAQPASDDEIVISDGGTLKRLDIKHIQNTPAIYAILSSNQSISNDSSTVAALATEVLDSDGTFDNSNYRWTPAVAGYYMLVGQVYFGGVDDGERIYCSFFINGSEANHNSLKHGMSDWSPGSDKALHEQATAIVYLDGDDYVDFRIAQSSGDSQNALSSFTYMAGFRITGV